MSIAMEYKGFLLTAVEQPNGGYMVEIMPIEGGKSVLTQWFSKRDGAMTSAKAMIDNGVVLD